MTRRAFWISAIAVLLTEVALAGGLVYTGSAGERCCSTVDPTGPTGPVRSVAR